MKKLQTAKGVRDFKPKEKIIRDKIINTIREVMELYGYNPIELPILERYDTLAAKFTAGEESDAMKEVFTLKDNGDRDLGLRYDLTVPFSRFIGMNPNMKMPFKKYVYGQVFRDGPIKTGRYRQFMQFDPDVVGCGNVIADAEILAIAETVFSKLGFEIEVEVNNRKILSGIMEDLKIPEKKKFDVTISIDKFKKIGKKGVKKELKKKGFEEEKIEKLFDYLKDYKSNQDALESLKKIVKSKIGKEGLQEMEEILEYSKEYELDNIRFLPSLARGLAYYTGPVFEVFLKDSKIKSSAAGGGRYDEMIGKFLGKGREYPATGISFGIEVIVEALREKEKFDKRSVVEVFVLPIKTKKESIRIAQKLRKAGINTDMDLMERGISSNLQYADSYNIPYVLFVGRRELEQDKVKLRDMKSGEEELLSLKEVIKKLK